MGFGVKNIRKHCITAQIKNCTGSASQNPSIRNAHSGSDHVEDAKSQFSQSGMLKKDGSLNGLSTEQVPAPIRMALRCAQWIGNKDRA